MDRTKNITSTKHSNKDIDVNDQSLVMQPPETFINMQQQMEFELERRRKDWEKEVEKMQEDFFNVKIPKEGNNINKNVNKTIEVKSEKGHVPKSSFNKGDIFEIGNAKTIYNDKPDGSKVVTFKFDVTGFDPSAMTVRAEGNNIMVSAEYEEEHYPGNKNTRKHNRQVDIPPGVDPDDFTSYLSADGILTVEAPVKDIPDETNAELIGMSSAIGNTPSIDFQTTHYDMQPNQLGSPVHYVNDGIAQNNDGPVQYSLLPTSRGTKYRSISPRATKVMTRNIHTHIPKGSDYTTVTPGGTVIVRSSDNYSDQPEICSSGYNSSFIASNHSNIVTTPEGQRLKISVRIGTHYKPEEIKVNLRNKNIEVKATHEETIGGRISKSEFSRDFDIPKAIEPKTIKAVVSSDGNLTIGGSVKNNKNHDQIMGLVLCDMPFNGRACKVITE